MSFLGLLFLPLTIFDSFVSGRKGCPRNPKSSGWTKPSRVNGSGSKGNSPSASSRGYKNNKAWVGYENVCDSNNV